MLTNTVALIVLVLAQFAAVDGAPKNSTLQEPYIIDLGYQLNRGQAIVNNTLIAFRNIRYAAPPLGSLRFQQPTSPAVNRPAIQNASDVICPQAPFSFYFPFTTADIPPIDPRTSEDCLFLDVLLPKKVWERRQRSRAAVLVWIHGGGWDIGSKDQSGRGYGLVARSQRFGSPGVIRVSINYRLGLFGWMHGPGVKANAGLLDQRLTLEWVQKHIHVFGGDPSRVTIVGESAGASSIEAHITAYGGSKEISPFKGAIAQSPLQYASYPFPNSRVDAVLRYGNITSVNMLRNMSSADLQQLNALLIGNAQPYRSTTFSPVPDGEYIPNLPVKLLQQGRFDHTLSIMTGHNQDEGPLFSPNALITNEQSYESYLKSFITPLASNASALHYITQVLYPPIFDGSQGYTNQTERNNLTLADAEVVCFARSLDQASFVPAAYAYEFSGPPSLHGADLAFTFYDFDPVPGVNATVAEILQGYLTRFVETGQPNAPTLPVFEPVGPGLAVQNIGSDFVGPMLDERGNNRLSERCRFWQDLPYLLSYQSANATSAGM